MGGHSPEAAMGSVGSPSSRLGAAGARALLDRRRSLDRDTTDSDSPVQLEGAQVGHCISDCIRRHKFAEPPSTNTTFACQPVNGR